jgi:hypothetical protein
MRLTGGTENRRVTRTSLENQLITSNQNVASDTEDPRPARTYGLRKLESEDVGTSAERRRQVGRCEVPLLQPLIRSHDERAERANDGNDRTVDLNFDTGPVASGKKNVPCAIVMFVRRRAPRRIASPSRRVAGAWRGKTPRSSDRMRRAAQLAEAHERRQRGHQNREKEGRTRSTHRGRMIHRGSSARESHR